MLLVGGVCTVQRVLRRPVGRSDSVRVSCSDESSFVSHDSLTVIIINHKNMNSSENMCNMTMMCVKNM